jgi:hypothetical protein
MHPSINLFAGQTSAEVVAILHAKPTHERKQLIQEWTRNWKAMNEKFFIQQ